MEDRQEERKREETRRLKRGPRQGTEVRQWRAPGRRSPMRIEADRSQLKRAVKCNRWKRETRLWNGEASDEEGESAFSCCSRLHLNKNNVYLMYISCTHTSRRPYLTDMSGPFFTSETRFHVTMFDASQLVRERKTPRLSPSASLSS